MESGLVLEGVYLRDRALHEKEDDALGPGREVRRFRGQGLGARLLMDALYRSLRSSNQVASAAVVVDAKDASAETFYKKYGFIALPNVARRLFLPMGTVEELYREDK